MIRRLMMLGRRWRSRRALWWRSTSGPPAQAPRSTSTGPDHIVCSDFAGKAVLKPGLSQIPAEVTGPATVKLSGQMGDCTRHE